MAWTVRFHSDFEPEFAAFAKPVRLEILARTELLETLGPYLKRPHADTLAGSAHANMKELRIDAADGVWRIAYAFDPARESILLVAGDKSGVSQKRFYRSLIERADRRFDQHLDSLKGKLK